jgi:hypothetical protein
VDKYYYLFYPGDIQPRDIKVNEAVAGYKMFGNGDPVDWTKNNYDEATGKLVAIPIVVPPEPQQPTATEIKSQKLQTLDWQYQPQFAELVNALGIATLSDSTDLITSIKVDYTALRVEYDTKRGEIDG